MTGTLDKPELNRIETQLSALCDELRREIEGEKRDIVDFTQSHGQEFTPQNQNDVGSDMFLQDRALGAEHALEAELKIVEQALQRIAAGTYGACAECSTPISAERLRARPQAIRCLDCERQAASR
jgi:RNA polymerase-binding transcription factor DksA